MISRQLVMMFHILLCASLFSSAHSYEFRGYDVCNGRRDCSSCISSDPMCSWCADEGEDIDRRCRTQVEGVNRCSNVTNPRGQSGQDATTLKEKVFGVTDDDGSIVQIRPQTLKASVRNGSHVTFTVRVEPAKDFPLDLYFLMDHSNSMKKTLDILKKSVGAMSAKLKELTKDHRIGFGTFVDKTTAPFIYTTDARKKNPCAMENSDNVCPPAYNFNNTVSLNEFEEFSTLIESSEVSASVDLPEAGMDALMQVAACKAQIGWRDHSRKVIVYLTDTGFHFAGDGKLGGQVERNDGECWLEDGRTYSKEQILDYPSIHQVVKKMVEKQMIPIFGVTEKVERLYKDLGSFFPYGSTGVLQKDSSNLVDLIVNEYENISSKIAPRQTESIKGIKMEYKAKCPRTNYEAITNGECTSVGIEEHAEFLFTVSADQCLAVEKEMVIEFTGFGQLKLNLSTLCDCECALKQESGPDICSGNGKFECGACVCDPGISGDNCDCIEGDQGDLELCKLTPTSRTCSGTDNGKCRCGECDCIPPNYGPYCQCNDDAVDCECSGHGSCECPANATQSMCVCEEGWTGNTCSCTDDKTDCMFNGFECDNHGSCECGRCTCQTEPDYTGKFCHLCEFCDKCAEFEECVLCVVGTSDEPGQDPAGCDACDVAFEVRLTDLRKEEDSEENWCVLEKEECTYNYYYAPVPDTELQQTRQLLYINNEPDCGPVNIIWVIVGVMLAIICMGIIVICCWKCIVMYTDKQEYKKFIEDMENTKFASTQSPLYSCPITHVNNPIAKKM